MVSRCCGSGSAFCVVGVDVTDMPRRQIEPNQATPAMMSLGLRGCGGRLLARLAGLRRLRRTLDVDAALVEPERRVAVGHQRYINQQPVAPPIDSNCKIKKARGITGREQHGDSRDRHAGTDQAGSGIADHAIFLHAYGDDITGADKRPDEDVLREGEQPFHQW